MSGSCQSSLPHSSASPAAKLRNAAGDKPTGRHTHRQHPDTLCAVIARQPPTCMALSMCGAASAGVQPRCERKRSRIVPGSWSSLMEHRESVLCAQQ